MGKLWGVTLLCMGSCVAPEVKPVVMPAAAEPVPQGTAEQLDAVADLREGVEQAVIVGGALARARNPVTGWMTDGAMVMIAYELEARRDELRRRGASRLVSVSMMADVDPVLDQLLRDLGRE